MIKFFIKGGTIGCFRMAARYAPVAFSEINTALSENRKTYRSTLPSGKLRGNAGTKDGRIRHAYGHGGGICGRYRLKRRCLWGIGSRNMDHRQ